MQAGHTTSVIPAQVYKAATSIRAQGRNGQRAAGEHPGVSKLNNQPGRTLTATDRTREDCPAGTVRSPPPEPAMLFSRDAHRHTPEVAADVVAQTCELLLTMREPGLRPIWCHDQVPGHACMCGCGALVALV